MIRATYSAENKTIDVKLPSSWSDLTQEELLAVYKLMGDVSAADVKFFILKYLLGLHHRRMPKVFDGKQRFTLHAYDGDKLRRFVIHLTPEMFAGWLDELDWIDEPGDRPVRLDEVGGVAAANAQFHGVTFRTYYMIENYFQGFLASQNVAALAKIEQLLYPDIEQPEELDPYRQFNIINWIAQIKNLFSRHFKHFFRPTGGESVSAPNMLEIMNNEIRILTGGDVTKEAAINEIDCWRALTELDYKAKEAEELRREYNKLKKNGR